MHTHIYTILSLSHIYSNHYVSQTTFLIFNLVSQVPMFPKWRSPRYCSVEIKKDSKERNQQRGGGGDGGEIYNSLNSCTSMCYFAYIFTHHVYMWSILCGGQGQTMHNHFLLTMGAAALRGLRTVIPWYGRMEKENLRNGMHESRGYTIKHTHLYILSFVGNRYLFIDRKIDR